jgi:hypothetical protein
MLIFALTGLKLWFSSTVTGITGVSHYTQCVRPLLKWMLLKGEKLPSFHQISISPFHADWPKQNAEQLPLDKETSLPKSRILMSRELFLQKHAVTNCTGFWTKARERAGNNYRKSHLLSSLLFLCQVTIITDSSCPKGKLEIPSQKGFRGRLGYCTVI